MNFIALVTGKEKMTRDGIAENLRQIEAEEREGVRYLSICWTLERSDAAVLFEAPNEKAAMKIAISRGDWADMETFVAVPAVDARKLVE